MVLREFISFSPHSNGNKEVTMSKEKENRLCSSCEEEINPKRLKALPHTSICVSCAEEEVVDTPSKESRPGLVFEYDHDMLKDFN